MELSSPSSDDSVKPLRKAAATRGAHSLQLRLLEPAHGRLSRSFRSEALRGQREQSRLREVVFVVVVARTFWNLILLLHAVELEVNDRTWLHGSTW